jgi:hypothetical protein
MIKNKNNGTNPLQDKKLDFDITNGILACRASVRIAIWFDAIATRLGIVSPWFFINDKVRGCIMSEKIQLKTAEMCRDKFVEKEIAALFVTKERIKSVNMTNKNVLYRTHLRRLYSSLRMNKIS